MIRPETSHFVQPTLMTLLFAAALLVRLAWKSPLMSIPPFATGLLISVIWFRHSVRDGGFELSWG